MLGTILASKPITKVVGNHDHKYINLPGSAMTMAKQSSVDETRTFSPP